jgi:hypothetical protein
MFGAARRNGPRCDKNTAALIVRSFADQYNDAYQNIVVTFARARRVEPSIGGGGGGNCHDVEGFKSLGWSPTGLEIGSQ